MEKRQTLILDINELYKAIPECKTLEGKNFKDIRELLTQLIEAVEKSGKWEFIQHVQNKPSLFIVREVTKSEAPRSEVSKTQFVKLEERINTISSVLSKVDLLLDNPEAVKREVLEDIKEIKEQAKISIYDNELFKKEDKKEVKGKAKSKLPWED